MVLQIEAVGICAMATTYWAMPAACSGSTMRETRTCAASSAASAMQRKKLISYYRGDVTVVDRKGLEAMACGCYADDTDAYSALMR